jgi:G3E family GTPase
MAEITPVTLLIGLSGAGKTTLLANLMRQQEMVGVAVVAAQPAPPMWWSGGCACCAPRDDVARALRALLPRVRRDEVRRVVIETSGLADPGPILATLLSDTVAASAYRLDGIVTVLDTVNGAAELDTRDMAVRQVAVADWIVLSKTDLADPPELRARLRRLNPGAPVATARHGAVDPEPLLGGGMLAAEGKVSDIRAWLDADAFTAEDQTQDPRGPAGRNGRIEAFCLTCDAPLSRAGMIAWLERLILLHGDALLRMKGVLHLRGLDRPAVIHSAGHLLFPLMTLARWPDGDRRNSRLMFITRDLPRAAVEAGLPALLDAPAVG